MAENSVTSGVRTDFKGGGRGVNESDTNLFQINLRHINKISNPVKCS